MYTKKIFDAEACLRKLYEENVQKLFKLAMMILSDNSKSEEAVYKCFVKLTGILSEHRYLSYEQLEVLSHILVQYIACEMTQVHSKEQYQSALEGLNIEERCLFTLQYVLKFTPKDISRLLEVPQNTICEKLIVYKKMFMNLEGM